MDVKGYYFTKRAATDVAPGGITVSKNPRLPEGLFSITEYSWGKLALWFLDNDLFTDDERCDAYNMYMSINAGKIFWAYYDHNIPKIACRIEIYTLIKECGASYVVSNYGFEKILKKETPTSKCCQSLDEAQLYLKNRRDDEVNRLRGIIDFLINGYLRIMTVPDKKHDGPIKV